MKYNTLLKGKLQEICAERGLSTEGTKDILIERLEENDKLRAELEEEPVEQQGEVTKDEPKEETVIPVKEDEKETVQEQVPVVEEGTETVAVAVAEEPVINEEDAREAEKKAQLDDLTKRIARARRFGDEEAAKDLESQKTRIEKFGLAPKPKPTPTPTAKGRLNSGVSKPKHGFHPKRGNKYHKNNRTR